MFFKFKFSETILRPLKSEISTGTNYQLSDYYYLALLKCVKITGLLYMKPGADP